MGGEIIFNRKKYLVQWRYDILKYWDTSFRVGSKRRALKLCFKMLARNSNCCPWRIIEIDEKKETYTIVFESSVEKKVISEYHVRNFTEEEKKKYYLPPIYINGGKDDVGMD